MTFTYKRFCAEVQYQDNLAWEYFGIEPQPFIVAASLVQAVGRRKCISLGKSGFRSNPRSQDME